MLNCSHISVDIFGSIQHFFIPFFNMTSLGHLKDIYQEINTMKVLENGSILAQSEHAIPVFGFSVTAVRFQVKLYDFHKLLIFIALVCHT